MEQLNTYHFFLLVSAPGEKVKRERKDVKACDLYHALFKVFGHDRFLGSKGLDGKDYVCDGRKTFRLTSPWVLLQEY